MFSGIVFIWLSESVGGMWARWPLLLGLAFVMVRGLGAEGTLVPPLVVAREKVTSDNRYGSRG